VNRLHLGKKIGNKNGVIWVEGTGGRNDGGREFRAKPQTNTRYATTNPHERCRNEGSHEMAAELVETESEMGKKEKWK